MRILSQSLHVSGLFGSPHKQWEGECIHKLNEEEGAWKMVDQSYKTKPDTTDHLDLDPTGDY